MNKKLLYINTNVQNNEYIYTGIPLNSFFSYLNYSIHNLLLIKGNYIGNGYKKNFELIEGDEAIQLLTQSDFYDYGDLCFVDYCDKKRVEQLSDEEIAELLYLGHMYKPLKSPFFEVLENRIVYLSHDNDFFCKLYCKDMMIFFHIVMEHIKSIMQELYGRFDLNVHKDLKEWLIDFSEKGLLIDFSDIQYTQSKLQLKIYVIGKQSDMDMIFNNCSLLKQTAVQIRQVSIQDGDCYLG